MDKSLEYERNNVNINLRLSNIFADEQWETSVGQLIREAVNEEILRTVREGVRSDVTLHYAIKKLSDAAIDSITRSYIDLTGDESKA